MRSCKVRVWSKNDKDADFMGLGEGISSPEGDRETMIRTGRTLRKIVLSIMKLIFIESTTWESSF